MSNFITNRISLCSIVTLSFLGVAANESLAGGSDCTANATYNVCVEWSQGDDPVLTSDYDVTFHGIDAPDLELKKGDSGWIVYCELVSGGAPGDIGVFTTPGGDADYTVKILNGAAGGFDNVGSMSLVPTSGKSSSIASGSLIAGDISGAMKLVESTGGSGGELGGLIIVGDVDGLITLPKVTGLNIILGSVSAAICIGEIDDGSLNISGALSADCDITEGLVDGSLAIVGTVSSSVTIQIADMESLSSVVLGAGDPLDSSFEGSLVLDTGLADSDSLVTITANFEGSIDLTDDPVAGTLTILNGTGDVIDGGALSGTAYLGSGACCTYGGIAEFTSVSSLGTVQTGLPTAEADFDGQLIISGAMAGTISLLGDFGSTQTTDGLISITGAVTGDILIGGDVVDSADVTLSTGLEGGSLTIEGDVPIGSSTILIDDMISSGGNHSLVDFQQDFGGTLDLRSGIKANQEVRITGEFISNDTIDLNNGAVAGTLKLLSGGDGVIDNGGAISGTVILADGSGNSYTGTADFASVSEGGVIKTLNSADLGGDLTISGVVSGDISLSGDLTSDGSITVSGALANGHVGGGRIMVTGETSGPIKVGEKTATLTLIQLAGGLATAGSIEINTTTGNFNAEGSIHVGGPIVISLPAVTFDGCIRIYDDGGVSPKGGALKGDLTVVGCHADEDELTICIDGSDNDNVTLHQTDCDPANATWDCFSPGCP